MTLWESDPIILLMKQGNACGGKGSTDVRGDFRDTSTVIKDRYWVSTKLKSITLRAKEDPNCRFTSLAHLLTEDFLVECFWELKKGKAPGIDGVTIEKYAENLSENISDLVLRLKAKQYRPLPVKRAYIDKSKTEKRPLGIPAVEDKLVQYGIKRILESIYEQDFYDISYGFRPDRSCHDALDILLKTLMTKPMSYVVDMDIAKFFDTVDHEWMMRCLRQRVVDSSLLNLIGRFLRAGVMEEGKYIKTDKGTPQGGILSPVLANIYLHYALDRWFLEVAQKGMKGFAQLVRYADDFVVCFRDLSDAENFWNTIVKRLEAFGLNVSEEKSKIIAFGRKPQREASEQGKRCETFDFLGFTHYCDKSRKGKFKVGRMTSNKKFRQKVKNMNDWLRYIRNRVKLEEWWPILVSKLVGHYRYYGISGNARKINNFYQITRRLTYKWINRRSQKKSYNWKQFSRFLEFNPLPQPKIYHSPDSMHVEDAHLKSRMS